MDFVYGFLCGACLICIISFWFFKLLLNQQKASTQKSILESSSFIQGQSEQSLKAVLDPLKEKLSEYQKIVEDTYNKEARERFSLEQQVDKLIDSNAKVGKEAQKLSQSLKGDVKTQGIWGEMILERVLEQSGLRSGSEYTLQGSLKSSEGNSFRPDAIVELPNNTQVIIDSKVSLKNYLDYLKEEDEEKKKENLKLLKKSFQSHIDGLAKKNYQDLEEVNTPSFVFLFVPVESAYIAVLESFSDLSEYAANKNIIVVTPSTLMASLKTVASIWQIDRQEKNSQLMAKKAGLLYDKFVAFHDDLEKVGSSLDKAQKNYHDALNKLSIGKGNLVAKSNELKELGAKSSKSLIN